MTRSAVAESVTVRDAPDADLEHLWESVIVDADVKARLVNHALLAMRMRANLPFEVSAIHGLVALVGPPGTGKTTLARGLVQQLAGVLRSPARLLDVNPHGLMSSEHGRSQQLVEELLLEYLPSLADGRPTIVLLDEVESMAVARSETSLTANPVDVHRATDAVLTAIDQLAHEAPNLVFVVTSNFVRGLDAAFLSRADAVIEFPLPDHDALEAILRHTLLSMASSYPALGALARDRGVVDVARAAAGLDGRQARKLVARAMASRTATALDPERLSLDQLMAAARAAAGASVATETPAASVAANGANAHV